MAVRFCTSCSRLAQADLGQDGWGNIISPFGAFAVVVGGGRNGMDCIHTGYWRQSGILAPIPGIGTSELVVHVAVNWASGVSNRPFLTTWESSAHHTRLWAEVDGSFTVRTGQSSMGTVLAQSQPGLIPTGVYSHWGVHIKINDTVGFYDVYKDGSFTPVFQSGLIDTRHGQSGILGGIGFGWDAIENAGTTGYNFCDVLITDMVDDGSGLVGYLGDVAVVRHRVVSDAAIQFSRGGTDSGTNAGQLDEPQINNDTDYTVGVTPGLRDLFEMQDLVIGNVNILGVQLVAGARKEGAGLGDLGFVTQAGSTGTEIATAGQTTAGAYRSIKKMLPRDPATDAAWTTAGWNATRCGYKKTA